MANLSNLNNKFLVTDGGNVLIGQTAVVGTSILQVEGSTNAIIRMNSTGGTGGRIDLSHSGNVYGNIGSGKNMLGTGNASDMMINADSLLILGVGSQDMTIIPSGNIGIGTDSPGRKLTIGNGNGFVNNQISLLDGGGTEQATIAVETTTANDLLVASKANLRFFTGSTIGGSTTLPTNERMRIVAAGAVGIDNSSPDSFSGGGSTAASLVVGKGTSGVSPHITLWQGNSAQASLSFASANTGTGQYEGRIRYTRDTGIMDFRTNGVANALVLGSTGNVGIGVNPPAALLHLSQAAGANIRFTNETTTNYFTIGEGVGTNNVFSFRGNSYRSTDTLSIDFVNDRVGIGTISPAYRLDVVGDVAGDWVTRIKNDSATGYGLYVESSSNAAQYMLGLHNGNGYKFVVDGAGIVNIGTATGTQPSYFHSYLNVQNNASTSDNASITITSGSGGYAGLHFGDSANGRIGQVAYNNSDDSLLFTANNSTRMTIDSEGKVGIRTTDPNQLLTLGGSDGTQTLSFTTTAYLGDQAVIGNIEFSTHGADTSYGQLANIYALKTGTNTNSGDITFWTKQNGGRAERIRIENDGTLRVKTGSIIIDTTSQGIYLGGTGSTHKLNFYQSGSWTPSVTSSGGGGFPAYSSIGYFQRVGKVVTVSFEFTISNLGTASGTVIINNLPVAIANGNGIKTVVGYGNIPIIGQSLTVYHYTALNQIGMNKYDGTFAGTTYTTRGTVTYWAEL